VARGDENYGYGGSLEFDQPRIRKKPNATIDPRAGGYVRAKWDEVTEMIAAANFYTIKDTAPRPHLRFLADPCHVEWWLCGRWR